MTPFRTATLATLLLAALAGPGAAHRLPAHHQLQHGARHRPLHHHHHGGGGGRVGVASWYGWQQHGLRMADTRRFHALGTSAASNVYPLGTRLRVTCLDTGRSAVVVVEDRMGTRRGRMVDLSLGTARVLGIERDGLARVRVAPIGHVEVPTDARRHT